MIYILLFDHLWTAISNTISPIPLFPFSSVFTLFFCFKELIRLCQKSNGESLLFTIWYRWLSRKIHLKYWLKENHDILEFAIDHQNKLGTEFNIDPLFSFHWCGGWIYQMASLLLQFLGYWEDNPSLASTGTLASFSCSSWFSFLVTFSFSSEFHSHYQICHSGTLTTNILLPNWW